MALAAYLGDHAACLTLGGTPAERGATARWVRGFVAFGHEAQVRAAVVVARRVLPVWDAQGGVERVTGRRARVREAIEAAEAWILTPRAELK